MPRPTLTGIEKLFLLSVGSPNQVELQGNVVEASQRAGVRHSVFNESPAYFNVLLGVPLLTAVLTIGLLIFTARAWKEGYWSAVEFIEIEFHCSP